MKIIKWTLSSLIVFCAFFFVKSMSVNAYYNCVYAQERKDDADTNAWIVIQMSSNDETGQIVSIKKRIKGSNGKISEYDYTERSRDPNFTTCIGVDTIYIWNTITDKSTNSEYEQVYVIQDRYSDSSNSNQSSGVFDTSNSIDFMKQEYVSCGGVGDNALVKNIPSIIPSISSSAYNIVLVVVPVVMVLMGMLDLVKGIISQKEDEIRKGRSSLVKRLVMGLVTFLVVLLVKMLINLVAGGNSAVRIVSCLDCFVNNDCTPRNASSTTT